MNIMKKFWQHLKPFLPFCLITGIVMALCFILDAVVHSGPFTDKHFFEKFEQRWPNPLAARRNMSQMKYEDPLATKGLAGALDARQQNTGALEPGGSTDEAPFTNWMMRQGMIPVSQAAFMEEIEQWISTEEGNETVDPKGVTSEEFDRFLEERAKVADRLPTLPNAPTGTPSTTSTNSGPQRKKDKDEDAMFAL